MPNPAIPAVVRPGRNPMHRFIPFGARVFVRRRGLEIEWLSSALEVAELAFAHRLFDAPLGQAAHGGFNVDVF